MRGLRLAGWRRDLLFFAGTVAVLAALGAALPEWLRFYLQVSLAGGLAALAVSVLMRAGLLSFGHGLYFCIGGYAAGMAAHFWGIADMAAHLPMAVAASGVCGYAVSFFIARYREIFFAMLSLAFSMILYGLLVKAEALGSTDGFNLPPPTYFGWAPSEENADAVSFAVCALATAAALVVFRRYLLSPAGLAGDCMRENELRMEYLGVSANRVARKKYTLSAMLAGLAGALAAVAVGHVDPDMAYWTTSGHFVFIALLSGGGHVVAPLIGSFFLEVVRIYAVEAAPHAWQIILGSTMLATALFFPKGLWSLVEKAARR